MRAFVHGLRRAGLLLATTACCLLPAAAATVDPAAARAHWAFQPPRPAPAPTVHDAGWPHDDIDRFLLARMEAAGLRPSPDADPATLLRRVTFDLTGLPPSPEDVERFLTDPSPAAYAATVDRLLASPAFGERWGRHWLDVARYGESAGKERNFAFPEAWRYRDWVIDAVNADLPYDQFIRQQIAGDLLPAADAAARDRQVVATGFLAVGPKGLNERLREQFLMDVVDEQVDVASRAMLGMSIACARCHDHKSEPVTQRDYYALAGIFRSTETLYGTADQRGNRHPSGYLPLTAAHGGQAAGTNAAAGPRAMGVREGRPVQCAVLAQGDIARRGERVPRGFVGAIAPAAARRIPSDASGRRELADWMVDRSNPLAARVAVNRVWAHLFCRGLVATPDNFGLSGEPPSHPELLDRLASDFMDDGWSVKRLVRRLVLGHGYRLASGAGAAAAERDPENLLHTHAALRRLDAEEIRDAMLSAAGLLDLEPPRGSPVSAMGDGPVRRPAPGGDRRNAVPTKRSVYLPVVRGFVPEPLQVFDFAEPSLPVSSREATNVPEQSLYLMNSPQVNTAARALVRRVAADDAPDRGGRIRRLWLATLGRGPSPAEARAASDFLDRNGGPLRAWPALAQSLLACAEFRFLR